MTAFVAEKDRLRIEVELSDYAHYLASRNEVIKNRVSPCETIHTSVVIETSDGFFLIAEMGDHTSAPSQLQFVGGGITRQDLEGPYLLNDAKNAKTEMLEETGLDAMNPSCVRAFTRLFIKRGRRYKAVGSFFHAVLCLTEAEAQTLFQKHNRGLLREGKTPELSKLIPLKKKRSAILHFIEQHGSRLEEGVEPALLRFC